MLMVILLFRCLPIRFAPSTARIDFTDVVDCGIAGVVFGVGHRLDVNRHPNRLGIRKVGQNLRTSVRRRLPLRNSGRIGRHGVAKIGVVLRHQIIDNKAFCGELRVGEHKLRVTQRGCV